MINPNKNYDTLDNNLVDNSISKSKRSTIDVMKKATGSMPKSKAKRWPLSEKKKKDIDKES
jgi:hypothetical protein